MSHVADEFSELCDALRDKYGMSEGDWKALLDNGMALYARIPDPSFSARLPARDGAARVANPRREGIIYEMRAARRERRMRVLPWQ